MKSVFYGLLIGGFTILAALAILPAKVRGAIVSAKKAERDETDFGVMLWAIRQVESGDDPRRTGLRGERSAYQFMRSTWEQHTRADFMFASTLPALADEVANKHAQWLQKQLRRELLGSDPIFFAAAWRYGVGGAARHARSDYAGRVMALYWERMQAREGTK